MGAAALSICTLVLIASLFLGRGDEAPPTGIYVDFPAAAGLKVGSKVNVAGVPVGEVSDLSAHDGAFDKALGRRVYVRAHLEIAAEMAPRIRQDAVFTITTEGVLGERYVEITPGGHDAPPLASGVVLPGARSFQQKELGENASEISRVVGRLVRRHSGPLQGLGGEVGAMLEQGGSALERSERLVSRERPKVERLKERLEAGEAGASGLGEALERVADGPGLKAAQEDLSSAAATLEKGGSALDADVQTLLGRFAEVQEGGEAMAQRVSAGLERARVASRKLPRDLRAIRALINSAETSLGALLSDREFLDDVLGLTKDVKRHPWKLLMRWEH